MILISSFDSRSALWWVRDDAEAALKLLPELNESERRVFDVIWRYGPIARVDIGPKAQLSTMSVTRITRDLADMGLLTEGVLRSGGRGQPTRPLVVRPEAAYSAGVYFSTEGINIGLIDLSGAKLGEECINRKVDSPEELAAVTRRVLNGMLEERQLAPEQVCGVGFAAPGDFIADRKRLNAHPLFPGFRTENLQAELEAGLGFAALVENDAASAALGERLFGVGQTIPNFFFAHIGHGIGGGLVLRGRLFRGANGNAGLIGVQFPNGAPRPSGQDLLDTLRASDIPVEDFPDLEALRPQTCPPLKRWLVRAADQLRQGLWITARVLDPEAIVIGGRLPQHLLQDLVARIDQDGFCTEGVGLPRPSVMASSLGPMAGVLGAAAVPLYSRFFGED